MTGIVLALAGLTCGDGRPGMGAATAPVAVGFDRDMDGEWGGDPCVKLRHGVLTIYGRLGEGLFAYSMKTVGEGKVRVTDYQGRSWLGTCWLEGHCLFLCWDIRPDNPRPPRRAFAPGLLAVKLRPAALRKP